MPMTLTAQIEAEIAKKRLRYIELFKVDLGTFSGVPYVFYWSDKKVPSTLTFDGQNYEPRMKRNSLEKLPRGKTNAKVSMGIANHDGFVKDLYESGVTLENGKVSVVRIFPDLAPAVQAVGTWDAPYWHARIKVGQQLYTGLGHR